LSTVFEEEDSKALALQQMLAFEAMLDNLQKTVSEALQTQNCNDLGKESAAVE
jgi:hypothetical protein